MSARGFDGNRPDLAVLNGDVVKRCDLIERRRDLRRNLGGYCSTADIGLAAELDYTQPDPDDLDGTQLSLFD